MTSSYTINGKKFPTQKDLIKSIQSILHGYPLGNYLNKNDFEFIMDLLSHHSEAREKIGCGVEAITTGKNQHGTTSFYIKRKDGSGDDFSYLDCIKNYATLK